MGERRIYLVRHGQYAVDAAPEDGLGGSLTDLGRQQAERTGERFSRMRVDVIIHSGLRRARETAEIIASQLPGVVVSESALLRECIPCIPIGYESAFASLSPEQLAREAQQARAAYEAHFTPSPGAERHDLLVCHGNLIRYFMLRVLQAPVALWANAETYTCGVGEVWVRADGRATLVSHNESDHLPPEWRMF